MTPTETRELLELAAKAAEIEGTYVEDYGSGDYYYQGNWMGILYEAPDGHMIVWNPLTDDGDALRLAVKLRLNVILEFSPTYHYAENDEYEALEDMNGCCTRASECNNDPYAATRRAIVRAAAEIGRTMP